MRTRFVATALADAAGHAPRENGFSANHTLEKPARSAATACSTHCCGVNPPWHRSAMRGALDIPRPRHIAGFGEMRVDRLPVAVLSHEHHRRARGEGFVWWPDVGRAGFRPPGRSRLAMARDHRHVAPHDNPDVERLPPAAFLVLCVVPPEPAPVLEPDVGM